MIILDPDGLFNGDRLRACSNIAQLHFHRLLLASNGFGRLELNYHKIIGKAYSSFRPPPSEADIHSWVQEYVTHHLLFPYWVEGQLWAQWDTSPRLLPRYKSGNDRRSPAPPEAELIQWKQRYLAEKASFPKSFGNFPENSRNISESFCPVVVVAGVGVDAVADTHKTLARVSKTAASDLDAPTSERFEEFWGKYPRKQRKDFACSQFVGLVTLATEAAVFSCLDRYLASDEVGRGVIMNPDKWLYEQHRNGWEGDWPRRESKDLSDKMQSAIMRNLKDFGRI